MFGIEATCSGAAFGNADAIGIAFGIDIPIGMLIAFGAAFMNGLCEKSIIAPPLTFNYPQSMGKHLYQTRTYTQFNQK